MEKEEPLSLLAQEIRRNLSKAGKELPSEKEEQNFAEKRKDTETKNRKVGRRWKRADGGSQERRKKEETLSHVCRGEDGRGE